MWDLIGQIRFLSALEQWEAFESFQQLEVTCPDCFEQMTLPAVSRIDWSRVGVEADTDRKAIVVIYAGDGGLDQSGGAGDRSVKLGGISRRSSSQDLERDGCGWVEGGEEQ